MPMSGLLSMNSTKNQTLNLIWHQLAQNTLRLITEHETLSLFLRYWSRQTATSTMKTFELVRIPVLDHTSSANA